MLLDSRCLRNRLLNDSPTMVYSEGASTVANTLEAKEVSIGQDVALGHLKHSTPVVAHWKGKPSIVQGPPPGLGERVSQPHIHSGSFQSCYFPGLATDVDGSHSSTGNRVLQTGPDSEAFQRYSNLCALNVMTTLEGGGCDTTVGTTQYMHNHSKKSAFIHCEDSHHAGPSTLNDRKRKSANIHTPSSTYEMSAETNARRPTINVGRKSISSGVSRATRVARVSGEGYSSTHSQAYPIGVLSAQNLEIKTKGEERWEKKVTIESGDTTESEQKDGIGQ
nr:hypothetical protein [Tanacetum cinerariifolium]